MSHTAHWTIASSVSVWSVRSEQQVKWFISHGSWIYKRTKDSCTELQLHKILLTKFIQTIWTWWWGDCRCLVQAWSYEVKTGDCRCRPSPNNTTRSVTCQGRPAYTCSHLRNASERCCCCCWSVVSCRRHQVTFGLLQRTRSSSLCETLLCCVARFMLIIVHVAGVSLLPRRHVAHLSCCSLASPAIGH